MTYVFSETLLKLFADFFFKLNPFQSRFLWIFVTNDSQIQFLFQRRGGEDFRLELKRIYGENFEGINR